MKLCHIMHTEPENFPFLLESSQYGLDCKV